MRLPSENNPIPDDEAGRRILSRLLCAAFPGRSENDIAERASLVLGVTDRQVRNWLRGVHDAKARHVMALIVLVGVEKAARLIEGRGR